MGGSGKHSGDLLGLERITPLEKRLRVCSEAENSNSNAKPDKPSVLSRVQEFLPLIDTANRKLSSEIKENGLAKLDIEHLIDGDEAPHIKMDLALGLAELYNAEAVAAAQQAIGGRVQDQPELCDQESESDSDDDDEEDQGHEDEQDEDSEEENKRASKAKQ